MKTKSIILSGLLLIGLGAATTSCEDMFTPDNEHVTTNPTPQDTVYQVMGIVGKMQHLVDRTALLGEVRADLVNVTDKADKALQDLAAAAKVTTENTYNNPADYYAVINSCNIYLAHVDSLLKTHGEYKFLKEIIAVKSFRAWTYLELAKIYGEVPLILEPIMSANAAEEAVNSTENKKGMVDICTYFINDLSQYEALNRNDDLRPSYGGSFNEVSLANCFIPVRVMLGELYLWRASFLQSQADYREAARCYHNFLMFPGEERPAQNSFRKYWQSQDFEVHSDSYFNCFNVSNANSELVTFIPMDTVEYYGTYCDIRALYNSSYKNDYYVSVTPSTRIQEISQAPIYCWRGRPYDGATTYLTAYGPRDLLQLTMKNPMLIGDLRLSSVYQTSVVNDLENDNLNANRQTIYKYNNVLNQNGDQRTDCFILYRLSTIYLHMAEALNRAGLPETAFAVLKYGLADDIISDSTIISKAEQEELKTISAKGFAATFYDWDTPNQQGEAICISEKRTERQVASATQTTVRGMHDSGSGNSYANAYYIIPVDATMPQPVDSVIAHLPELLPEATEEEIAAWKADSTQQVDNRLAEIAQWRVDNKAQRQAEVDSLILDELALEGMFEGQRFYDLMRYSKYSGKTTYLGDRVAERTGKDTPDAALKSFYSTEQNWYLELRQR